MSGLVPGLRVVSSYGRKWLAKDIIAGVVLTTLLVPQGMAYAELAGLPPITGLYTSIMCLLGYAVFGPSRILVLGPDSSLGPMIAERVTDRGGRTVRRENPAHRDHRRRPDHRDDRADPGPVPEPAQPRAGRRGDHRVAVPGRPRLYQLRSKITTSPAAGKCAMYYLRLMR